MDKLLLIDDEADVQYSFRRNFGPPEIELTTASSGEEGLKIIPRLKPDLVIMDVRMGGITGLETLRRIRQIDSRLLVILMTAYGKRCHRLGYRRKRHRQRTGRARALPSWQPQSAGVPCRKRRRHP